MQIKGLAWLGTRTEHASAMAGFFRDVLGVRVLTDEPEFFVGEFPNGDKVEVFGPGAGQPEYFVAPVVGFLVDDIAAARAELQDRGIEFLGPIEHGAGTSWSHFRAPDGHVYELTSRDEPGHP